MKKLIALVAILFSTSLCAQTYTFPVGHKEAFLGNAGGALVASPGNVLMNPAGLGFYEGDKVNVTVSGNALTSEKYGLGEIGTENEIGTVRPTLATGIFRPANGVAALFVSEPTSINVDSNVNQTVDQAKATGVVNALTKQVSFGASFANKIDETSSWGATIGIAMKEARQHSLIKITSRFYGQSNFNQLESKTKAFFINPGYLWQPHTRWTVGLSAYLTPFALESKGTQYSVETKSSDNNSIHETTSHFDPKGWSSNSAKISQAIRVNGSNSAFIDTAYEGGSKTRDAAGVDSNESPYWVWSMGWKSRLSESTDLMMGFSNSKFGASHSKLFTLGSVRRFQTNEVAYGAYYFDTMQSQVGLKVIGLMLSSNIIY
jgi:hypothetical protein